ncbi:MAG: peptide ligase PGM1-related protein [Alphaproteobacteria bacterium]|nr:peptide ligase PGM1-related protein [Alphaproteobacteria bacterium]
MQAKLPGQFRRIFADHRAPRTVLVVPSMSLDADVLAHIAGVHHYEERMLCLLLLLRLPRCRVVYVSSTPIADSIVDYYLHLLPGVPYTHARRRLQMIACHDAGHRPLTSKILERPRVVARIRDAIPDLDAAHMTCFNVSELEQVLAVRLGLPIYGCDPALLAHGSKSGSRKIFRQAGIDLPPGYEDLADGEEIAEALLELKTEHPSLERAVVKLNEGFSGEGNALFRFDGAPDGASLKSWIRRQLEHLAFEAANMTWEAFGAKIEEMGAIVEAFIEGEHKRSPSGQYRIDPTGQLDVISTHDQVLGGGSGQIFLGCRFPADQSYRLEVQEAGRRAAVVLRDHGVLGRFGVDFISVPEADGWRHYAIEINLRKGGTTHPFLMLQFLTDGQYDPEDGLFYTAAGQPRCYYASDNLENPVYRRLTPDDLIDVAVTNDLHFHGAGQQGVAFHLIGALPEFGKLGVLCVGDSETSANRFYEQTIAVLDRECRRRE